MAHLSKIATCCHCGTRAILRVKTAQHTLSCSACSAPLRQLKMLPTAPPVAKPAVTHQSSMSSPRAKVKHAAVPPPKLSKPRKKRKSLFRKFAEEAFDFAEDAFDFVEDIFD